MLSVSRATVIDAHALADPAAAGAWFDHLDLGAEATTALAVLNRLVEAHRIAAADPHVHPLAARAAIAVRGGFGEGGELARGSWTKALELRDPGGRTPGRGAALRPEERMAALLAGRDRPLACEELALRARLDLDLGRTGAAALGTRLALEATLVELGANARAAGLEARLNGLRELRDDVIAAANSAFVGRPTDAQRAGVELALGRVEATLRARSVGAHLSR